MKKIRRIALMIILMISIMVGGCTGEDMKPSKKPQASAQDVALEYLNRTYNAEFEIEELEKKDAGTFKTKEYIGYAYLRSKPDIKFKIWVDMDSKSVTDTYECIAINEYAYSLVSEAATDIWETVRVEFLTTLESKPKTDLSQYTKDNLDDYFAKEFSYSIIRLYVPKYSDIAFEAEKVESFLTELNSMRSGLLYVVYEDKQEGGELFFSLSANRQEIEKKLQKWEGNNG